MPLLLTKEQMQACDRHAIDVLGIPALALMELAGRAVADAAESLYRERAHLGRTGGFLAIAGLGNNGGDAVVAARHLFGRGHPAEIAVIGDTQRASSDLRAELAIAEKMGLAPTILDGDAALPRLRAMLDARAVAIDGLFGTGLTRPISGFLAIAIDAINSAKKPIVAVDIPSGVDADTGRILGAAIEAERTVTFQHAKLGHVLHPGRRLTGALTVADIGIHTLGAVAQFPASTIEPNEITEALPARASDTHKGTYGHLAIIAGAPDRPGSALLAGRAALTTGAGLVTVASDEETIRRLAPSFVELMGRSCGRERIEIARAIEALEGKTAIAIGPSLEASTETVALLRGVLEKSHLPVVIDAGALQAIATEHAWLRARPGPTILTPHPKEMARLSGRSTEEVQADRVGVAQELARKTGAHVVLKGASTVVAGAGGSIGVVMRGNPAMSTGGAGDVLTGVIGGMLAQGVDALAAARAGALLHAIAGDLAAEAGCGRIVASDIIRFLGRAMRP